jgi:hypothetical protein
VPVEHPENPWVPWTLVVAVVAFVYGVVIAIAVADPVRVVDHGDGRRHLVHAISGPLWLHGYFLSSWWEAAALLLIAVAVAAGVRSLIVIRRGVQEGLEQTVSALLLSAAALMAGRAILLGVLGVIASLVVYDIYARDRRRAYALAADSAFASEPYAAANPTWLPPRKRTPARTIAIRAFLVALVGPIVSAGVFAPPSLGPPVWLAAMAGAVIAVPLTVIALVYAIVALRRTLAAGEPGRGWAISAIVACVLWLVEFGGFLVYLYRELERNFT